MIVSSVQLGFISYLNDQLHFNARISIDAMMVPCMLDKRSGEHLGASVMWNRQNSEVFRWVVVGMGVLCMPSCSSDSKKIAFVSNRDHIAEEIAISRTKYMMS